MKARLRETDIQRAICDYLALKKHFFWRQNTAGMFREGRYFAMPKYSLNGLPDIILIKDGIFVGIEVKTEKGVQSDHQKAFAALCEQHGAVYFVARSVDDVIARGL